MRPTRPWLALQIAALFLAMFSVAACSKPSVPPLVLFITLDTTRADHLSCYGYFRETSPRIDGLAQDGILFEKAVTTMSTTLPAHVSLLTGTLPIRHGVESNFENSGIAFDSGKVHSLAPILSDAGWTTAAFVSAASLKRHTGINSGFDIWHEPDDQNPVAEVSAGVTTDLVIDWLETAPKGPLFLWVHYFDPHSPYAPPVGYERFASEGQEEFLREQLGPNGAADPEIRDINDRYDAEIRYADEQIGRLLDKLHEMDIYDDAAIAVVGDHGEGLGQHGWMTHGRIYNEQLFVPLVLKLPKGAARAGQRVSELVSIVDVIPTLAGAIGLPWSAGFASDGVDVLNGPARETALAARTSRERRKWEPGRRYALMTLDWKYLHSTQGKDMLFDMRRDFAERRDVSSEHPGVAARMREQLLAKLSSYEGIIDTAHGGDEAQISPEVEQQLKKLGYAR